MTIFLDAEKGPGAIDKVSEILKNAPTGETRVFVSVDGTKIRTSFSISPDDAILERLKDIEGVEQIAK